MKGEELAIVTEKDRAREDEQITKIAVGTAVENKTIPFKDRPLDIAIVALSDKKPFEDAV